MTTYKLNLIDKTLTVTKAFADAMNQGAGPEYELYQKLMREIPGLKVIRKTHATPKKYTNKQGEVFSRNQFKNLTYKNMETFMAALPDNEGYLQEYTFAREAAAKLQINGYKLIRKWFVAQFPDYRKNPMTYLTDHPAVLNFAEFQEAASESYAKAEGF